MYRKRVCLSPSRKFGRALATPGRSLIAEQKKLYGYRWQQRRVVYLKANPFCVFCARRGLSVAATVVDHIVPHAGAHALFWDESNWQSLCAPCHNGEKQKTDWADRGGRF